MDADEVHRKNQYVMEITNSWMQNNKSARDDDGGSAHLLCRPLHRALSILQLSNN